MRAMVALVFTGWAAAAMAQAPPVAMRELTAAQFAEDHFRNAFATEAALNREPFRFTGAPMAVIRGVDGNPAVAYATPGGMSRVLALLVPGSDAFAASIKVGEALTLVCTGASDGMVFPQVTGCRPASPSPTPALPQTPR